MTSKKSFFFLFIDDFLTSEALDLRDCLLPPIGALPTSQACGTLASAMIPQLEGIGRGTGICMPYRQP